MLVKIRQNVLTILKIEKKKSRINEGNKIARVTWAVGKGHTGIEDWQDDSAHKTISEAWVVKKTDS